MEPLRWVAYRVGYMFRETGQALERLGNRMQGSNAYLEPCAPSVCIARRTICFDPRLQASCNL